MKKAIVCNASIMTTNIVDYVGLCERLAGTNTMNFINHHYYGIIHKINIQHNGELNDMVADQQIAYWQLSRSNREAIFACKCAIEIIKEINNDQLKLSDNERFKVNISISTGRVTIGSNMVLGMIVSRSHMITKICKKSDQNILIDKETNEIIRDKFSTSSIGKEKIIGEINEIELYELKLEKCNEVDITCG
jgi:hypothetical protein